MKLIKKILSGAMALTMAASMMLSVAVQAGAETMSDKSHEFDVKWSDYYGKSKYLKNHKLSVGPFDSAEIKALQKEAEKYEYGKNGFIALFVRLADNDSDTNYQFMFVIDKRFAEDTSNYILFSITKNGMISTEDDYADVLGAQFSEEKGKTYLNLNFSSVNGIAKEIADCEEAKWAMVAMDNEGNVSTISLGNKTEKYMFSDYTVEDQESQGGKVKTIKHIAAEDNLKEKNDKDEYDNDAGIKDISKLKIKVNNMTYTGKSRKPSIKIKVGGEILKKGKDYTLSYKNNKEIGTATVTIKGKGDYTGKQTIEYKIVPKKTSIVSKGRHNIKGEVSLKWKAVDGAEKYQIYCSTNGGKFKKIATVSGKKTSYSADGFDFKNNKYRFKIRSYTTKNGKKYYSAYSDVAEV